jgi:hypothetical protein
MVDKAANHSGLETVFSSEIGDVFFDTSINAVQITWKAYATTEEFREVLHHALTLMNERKADKWLANTKSLGVINPEDHVWFNEVWMPQAMEAGTRRVAMIVSDDVFAQLSMDDIMDEVREIAPVRDRFFTTIEEAREWLGR